MQNKEDDCKGSWKVLNDLMYCKSENTQIREKRHTPTELATNPKDNAHILDVHFTETGKKLASEMLEPPSGISFETYLSRTNILNLDFRRLIHLEY